jgi:hypothetical protein
MDFLSEVRRLQSLEFSKSGPIGMFSRCQRKLWTPSKKIKAPSVVGGRFDGRQISIENYRSTLSFFCLTETSPIPTTEVAEMGLRLDLGSINKLAWSLNILGGILLRMEDMSMLLDDPFG